VEYQHRRDAEPTQVALDRVRQHVLDVVPLI